MSSLTALLRLALRLLLPLSVLLTGYLYLYPVFNGCAFPLPSGNRTQHGSAATAFRETVKLHLPPAVGHVLGDRQGDDDDPTALSVAPFRLLALGDPQLEGDSSIPGEAFPHLASIIEHVTWGGDEALSLRERVRRTLHDIIDFWFEDVPNTAYSLRKRLDLFGNDFYLAHVYRSVRWWSVPTHTAVLGDLLGSQWVDDDEFARRAHRYWTRMARGSTRVPDEAALYPADEYDVSGYVGQARGQNASDPWSTRIINVVGNHDIGYAGDITHERLARFEQQFGKANYELRFEMPVAALSAQGAASVYDPDTNPTSDRLVPELRIVNINDMNLDTPALTADLQDATYSFINSVINTATAVEFQGHFTVVLTHIPLHKPAGTCVDAPFFSFHDEDGTLREQNMLSEDASRGFLQGLFGMHGDPTAPAGGRGRPGVILNGHDHEGCDTYHFINQTRGADADVDDGEAGDGWAWESWRWPAAQEAGVVGRDGYPGLREITVRSMMGEFGGNAGLLSAWFDEAAWAWRFEYATCALGRQHFWWAVHIVDLVTLGVALAYGLARLVPARVVAAARPANPKGFVPPLSEKTGAAPPLTTSKSPSLS